LLFYKSDSKTQVFKLTARERVYKNYIPDTTQNYLADPPLP